METRDSIRFEVSSPSFVVPTIAIDVDRNGKIDSETDFQVSFASDGSPCLSIFRGSGTVSECRPLGGNAQVSKHAVDGMQVTDFTFPKAILSSDKLGFGFLVTVWNTKGNYGGSIGAGEYMFGGTLHTPPDGKNSTAEGIHVPAEIMPALHHYQGCLARGVDALGQLNQSKLASIKAVKVACAADRNAALSDSVKALVASGQDQEKSEEVTRGALDEIDAGFDRLIQMVEPRRQTR